jgi:hypothetical protein
MSVTACSQQLSPNRICLRKLLHEREKVVTLEGLVQRGVSGDFAAPSRDEANTLTGILFSNNSGQFYAFSPMWPHILQMFRIGQDEVVGAAFVVRKGFFVATRGIDCMTCLREQSRPY